LRVLHPRRNCDFLGHFFVDGFDIVVPVSVVEDADYGWMRARKRADDASFGASIGAYRGDFDQYAVAMHRGCNGMRRNKDISGQAGFKAVIERESFGNHEAVAVAMHRQAADQQIAPFGSLRNGEAFGVDLQQFSFANEGMDTVG
jgi:hypothetical protein